MDSIFTKIVRGEIPANKVAETESYLAFLDVRPMQEGHTLCIIKQQVDYIFDLSDEDLSGLMVFSKRVANGLEQVFDCERIAVGVLGLEVPHTHVHLVPVSQEGDFRFGKSVEVSAERQEEIARQVRSAVKGL